MRRGIDQREEKKTIIAELKRKEKRHGTQEQQSVVRQEEYSIKRITNGRKDTQSVKKECTVSTKLKEEKRHRRKIQ